MTILVTGAAGFIGSHTVDALLQEGICAVGVDDLSTGSLNNLAHAQKSALFRFEKLDLTDVAHLTQLMTTIKPAAVIHLAGLVSIQESFNDPALNYSLNVHATHIICEVSRQQRVPRVVFASSAAVYGEAALLPISESSEKRPMNPYGWAKLASESLLFSHAQSHGLTALSLRYFNVYGRRQSKTSPYSGVISRFEECIEAGRPITVFGTGEQTRDFIHVSDIARANLIAATKPDLQTEALNICTGKATSSIGFINARPRCGRREPRGNLLARARAISALRRRRPTRARRTIVFRINRNRRRDARLGDRNRAPSCC